MKIQSDILPFLKHVIREFGQWKEVSIGFETDLPDLTMDFDPAVTYSMLVSLLGRILEDYQPGHQILTEGRQLSPTHFSILVAFKPQGFLDVEPYRELLQTVEGELIHQITREGDTSLQIDLPIYNQCGYLLVQEVIKFLPKHGV